MFAGLGHDAFVGGDDEEGEVDPTDAGKHVLDEAFVAGHVDKADGASGGQLAPGETEIDGQAARFLFGPAIGVDAGERLHEGALAVVDVSGGADDVHAITLTAELISDS